MFQCCITSKWWSFSVNHFNFSSCKLCITPCYNNCLSKEDLFISVRIFWAAAAVIKYPLASSLPNEASAAPHTDCRACAQSLGHLKVSQLCPPRLWSSLPGGCLGCSSAKKRWISTSPTSWIQLSMKFFFQWEQDVDHLSPQTLSQLIVPKPVLARGVFLCWYKTLLLLLLHFMEFLLSHSLHFSRSCCVKYGFLASKIELFSPEKVGTICFFPIWGCPSLVIRVWANHPSQVGGKGWS